MGKLIASKKPKCLDVTTAIAWHRCRNCGSKYSVAFGSLLFPRVGGSMVCLTDNVLAFWYCVHAVSPTTCGKILDLSPQTVRRFYQQARDIMTFDALRKEAQIVFGALPDNKACEFEPDESVFFSWKDVVWTQDTETGSWKQETVYSFWV